MDWVLHGSSVTPTDASCLDFSIFVALCNLLTSHADIPFLTSCGPLAVFPWLPTSRRTRLCEAALSQLRAEGAQLARTKMQAVVKEGSLTRTNISPAKNSDSSVGFLVLTQTLCFYLVEIVAYKCESTARFSLHWHHSTHSLCRLIPGSLLWEQNLFLITVLIIIQCSSLSWAISSWSLEQLSHQPNKSFLTPNDMLTHLVHFLGNSSP